jgi:hypothetical protein
MLLCCLRIVFKNIAVMFDSALNPLGLVTLEFSVNHVSPPFVMFIQLSSIWELRLRHSLTNNSEVDSRQVPEKKEFRQSMWDDRKTKGETDSARVKWVPMTRLETKN